MVPWKKLEQSEDVSDEYKMRSEISTPGSLILLSEAGDELAEKGVHLGLGPAVLLKRAGFHAPEPASSLSLVGAVLPLGSCQDSRAFSWF